MYGSCCSRLPASENMGYMTGFCGDVDVMKTSKCRPWDPTNARALLQYLPPGISHCIEDF